MDQEKNVQRIRKLLAKADSTTFPAERDALRSKANQLLKAYGLTADQVSPPKPKAPPPPPFPMGGVTIVFGNSNVTTGHVGNVNFTADHVIMEGWRWYG